MLSPPKVRAGKEAPLYQIDLSLPPGERYYQICKDHQEAITGLIDIYNNILALTTFPRFFKFLGRRLLRRVYSDEETEELRGISKAIDIPFHLVVAYNTFLDLFSGCISGGVRTHEETIVHFRNLDWDMNFLRDLIIRVEYTLGGTVIARTVTYAGYTGILTGVREGLSISMNYRASSQSKTSNFRTGLHYLLILLGRQPSISSQLRSILLSNDIPSLSEIAKKFSKTKASSCYLTFCTPSSILIIEKSLSSAVIHTSESFLSVTNHDVAAESWSEEKWIKYIDAAPIEEALEIMMDSVARKDCMCQLWHGCWNEGAGRKPSIEDIETWLRTYPIRNECTHFSCIMDPSIQGGGLLWVETCVNE